MLVINPKELKLKEVNNTIYFNNFSYFLGKILLKYFMIAWKTFLYYQIYAA